MLLLLYYKEGKFEGREDRSQIRRLHRLKKKTDVRGQRTVSQKTAKGKFSGAGKKRGR